MPSLKVTLGLSAAVVGLVAMLVFGQQSAPAQPPASPAAPASDDKIYAEKIKPYLEVYCNSCHNSERNAGGLALDIYLSTEHAKKDRKVWELVHQKITTGEMPPPKRKQQPTKDESAFVMNWIDTELTKVDCTAQKDPGRVTIRRLNRAEYNRTIRDLCGVDFNPADDFPSDDVGYGFDNIGDVLSMQPILLEKYMAAADKILNTAIVSLAGVRSEKQTLRPQQIQTTPRSAKLRDTLPNGRVLNRIELTTEGAAFIERQYFPADGEYALRVRAWGASADGTLPKLVIRVDGKEATTAEVKAPKDKPEWYEGKLKVTSGNHRFAVSLVNPHDDKSRILGVEAIEVEGPIGGGSKPLPASTQMILTSIPKVESQNVQSAREVISRFARRAYRRPVKPEEIERLMRLYEVAAKEGDPYEQAIKLPLKAVLFSPHFLFRIEDEPKAGQDIHQLTDHELATRLSYFLWSSMPDEELSRFADAGELRSPGVLEAQIRRMLADARSSALVENFAGQWLMLRNLRTHTPDTGTFRDWDDRLRDSMIRETEMFFEHIMRENRQVIEFIDADYTFVNDRLARHYGINGVRGPEFQQVKFPDKRRGGLTTMASILTVTSNPTRTSPVKRGKWVYENILGLNAPPPAPDVPELPPVGELKGTLRQQMEQHRANPSCAICHDKLDPLGFGLENFDAIGRWRDVDNKFPIDASGELPAGEQFSGPTEMRQVLKAKANGFRRCIAEKMLTYAVGRGLEYYDKCALDEILAKLSKGDDRFVSLVVAIVESDPFQKRRGKRSE